MKFNYFLTNNELKINLVGDYLLCDYNNEVKKLLNLINIKTINKILIDANELKNWDSTLIIIGA